MAIDLPAPAGRRIALIAHDNKKQDMLEWAKYNLTLLSGHELFATATRSSALTSGSCGCGSSGSQRKTRRSIPPSAMRAPIC